MKDNPYTDEAMNSVATSTEQSFNASGITRPDRALLTYYVLYSLCFLIAAPLVFVPLWIRYVTMRYRFDEAGVAMSWGFFFRREVYLTYGRLQDIHVTRNIIERWLGLSKLPIQTASGSGDATMQIEGIREADQLRDFLYVRMRGAQGDQDRQIEPDASSQTTKLLRQILDELRRQRT